MDNLYIAYTIAFDEGHWEAKYEAPGLLVR